MVLTTGGMTSWSYKPVGCNALSTFEQPFEPPATPEYSPYRPFSQFGKNKPPKLDIPIILMPGQTGEVKNRVIPEHIPLPPDAYVSSTEFGFGAAQTHRKYSRTKSPPMTPNSSMRPLNDLYKTRARAPPIAKPPRVFWRSNVRGGGYHQVTPPPEVPLGVGGAGAGLPCTARACLRPMQTGRPAPQTARLPVRPAETPDDGQFGVAADLQWNNPHPTNREAVVGAGAGTLAIEMSNRVPIFRQGCRVYTGGGSIDSRPPSQQLTLPLGQKHQILTHPPYATGEARHFSQLEVPKSVPQRIRAPQTTRTPRTLPALADLRRTMASMNRPTDF